MKKIIYAFLMLAVVVPLVHAESGPVPGAVPDGVNRPERLEKPERPERQERVDMRKENREAFKNELRMNKEEFKDNRDMIREEWKRTATRTPAELKAKIEELKAGMKDRRQDIKARLASSTKEIKAKFDEKKKEVLKERIANISGKFDGAIARMEAFNTKVQEAISKFKARGVDTTNAESLLVVAQNSLEDVKANAEAFKSKADSIVDSEEVSRLALHEEAQVVIESIKDTHAAFVAVVVELRASGGNRNETENETESESENETEKDNSESKVQ